MSEETLLDAGGFFSEEKIKLNKYYLDKKYTSMQKSLGKIQQFDYAEDYIQQ